VEIRQTHHTYKTGKNGNVELPFDVFYPEGDGKNLPAIILFFGGAWAFGGRHKFYPQAGYFASHGYVVFTPDYRVLSRQFKFAKAGIDDAVAFWNHIKEHADEFGIDINRVALGGGSSGGHLALMAGILTKALPKVFVLFNPAVSYPCKRISPAHNLPAPFPPTIIFHGGRDAIVPLSSVMRFVLKVEKLDAEVRLYEYGGRTHGFFRKDRGDEDYADSNLRALQFFKEFL
jgi:acetyl esterase/lipase